MSSKAPITSLTLSPLCEKWENQASKGPSDFAGGSDGKEYDLNSGDQGSNHGSGRSLEKEMSTRSCILT